MIQVTTNTLSEAWKDINRLFVSSRDLEMDWNTTKREYYMSINNLVVNSSTGRTPGMYMENIGYSKHKIKHLLSKYLDKDRTNEWLWEITRWQNRDTPYFLQSKEPKNRYPGNCFIGFSFLLSPIPHLNVYSRAVEMPHKAFADCLLISSLVQAIFRRSERIETIGCTWFMNRVWITSRTARLYLIYQYPKSVTYKNKTFQSGMREGWERFFLGEEKLSSSNGSRMQKFFERKRFNTINPELDSTVFYHELENYLNGKN